MDPKTVRPEEPTPWERFEEFAKRLLAVQADEIRERHRKGGEETEKYERKGS